MSNHIMNLRKLIVSRPLIDCCACVISVDDAAEILSGPQLYARYPNGDEVYLVGTTYLCRDFSGTLAADQDEASDARFFALSDLPSDICPVDGTVLDGFLQSRDIPLSGARMHRK